MNRLASLGKKSSLFWMSTGCFIVAGVGVADAVTGSEFAFGLFYRVRG